VESKLAFCAEYKYPPELTDLLRRIVQAADGKVVRSLILLGSTSRGEFSWHGRDGRFLPLSDIELLVVTHDHFSGRRQRDMLRQWEEIETSTGVDSPSFHLDCSFLNLRKLRTLPTIFRTFETKVTGKVIAGENLLPEIPDVSLDNIDWRDLNEILIWRLWSMWLYMPLQFIDRRGELPPDLDRAFAYVIARNLLDLPSWMLPRAGYLLAGFGPRLSKMAEICDDLPLCKQMKSELLPLMDRCYAIKMGREEPQGALALYRQACRAFRLCWSELAGGQAADDRERPIKRNSRKLFVDWHWRRKGHEVRTILKNLDHLWIGHSLMWMTRPKYGPMLNLLIRVHQAVEQHLDRNEDEAAADLEAAYNHLRGFALRDSVIPGWSALLFADKVANLRRVFLHFMYDYFPSVAAKKDYLENLL